MTNFQIIEQAKKKLVADGKIQAEDEIHTYKHWKKLGYQVFRGEKAITSLNIWQYFQKASQGLDDDEGEQKQPEGKMRLKKAYFFSSKQVFQIE